NSLPIIILTASVTGILLWLTVQDETRIIGGEECPRNSQHFQVALMNRERQGIRCGGVLIAKDWVLTAAHCDTQSPISTRMGEHNLRANKGTAQCITSAKNYPHPRYDPNTHDNDIMLLRLRNSANLNNYVQPISLATTCAEPNIECQVSGWGTSRSPQSQYPDILQCGMVNIMSKEECDQAYPGAITDNMLCAGLKEGGVDSCQGDSGGPLECNGKLQGIVSWGMEVCAKKGKPGVYTNVCKYIPWIQKIMQNNSVRHADGTR
uniref:Peptidase S1 domain-containing protein n=1 Tax=Sphenodon punctatus TaxID=8508 RepID=A0A8D0GIG1_SPHPU